MTEALISLVQNEPLLKVFDPDRQKMTQSYSYTKLADRYVNHIEGSCLKTQSSTAQPKTKLPDNLFSLPAPAFVDTYSETVGVSETDLSPQDRDTLISAIRNGASRMRVIDAIDGRSAANVPVTRLDDQNAIRQPASQFALIDVLARFAPEDDVAFLRHVFARICERQPDKRERLEFEFDLRRGVIDRQTLISAQ